MAEKRVKNKKKPIIIISVAVVLIIMVVIGVKGTKKKGIPVQTQNAEFTDVISIVSGSGKVQPKTQVNIASEVNAEVISIPVKEGNRVSKGQILIQLDTVQATKDMESALYSANELSARLEGAKIQLAQLKENYERQKELHAKKMASEQSYKDAYYLYKNQEATIKAMIEQKKAADSRLEKAHDTLNKTTIKAPMNGVITWVDVEVGEIAQAQTSFTQGKTLMILSDISAFEVEVEIDETDIADLEVDQRSRIEIDAFPDNPFSGRVTEIGNTATTTGLGSNDQTTNFKVNVVLLEANNRIRPGMSATVDITTHEHKGVLAVPIQAIVMRSPEDLKDSDLQKDDKNDGVKSEQANTTSKTGSSSTSMKTSEVEVPPTHSSNDTSMTVKEGTKAEQKDDKDFEGTDQQPDTPTPSRDKSISKDKDKDKDEEDIKGVFINKNGIARFIPVTTGISDQQNIEILEGLNEGDEVVIGSFRTLRKLKDSDKISVENKENDKKGNEE